MVEESLMYFITLFNMENNYYVYRHFKKNTNYVFYIGIGKQLNNYENQKSINPIIF